MANSITADVGLYGKLKGFTKGNIAEFRGLPFATVPARFRRAEKITSVPGGRIDATKWGPYPAQPPEDQAAEILFFGEYVENHFAEEEQRTMSDDKSLNLNIVTPKSAIGSKKLPVMVWIYGTFPGRCRLSRRCILHWR
jgi:carboxylesterase type B